MAQIYLNDSKVMQHQGETQATYEAWPDYSVGTHTIVDIPQTFPADWFEYAWFWIPGLSQFVKRDNGQHPYLVALQSLFTAQRWEEILDALDEQGNISRYFDNLNLPKAKRKAIRARDKGLITTAELQALSQLINGV